MRNVMAHMYFNCMKHMVCPYWLHPNRTLKRHKGGYQNLITAHCTYSHHIKHMRHITLLTNINLQLIHRSVHTVLVLVRVFRHSPGTTPALQQHHRNIIPFLFYQQQQLHIPTLKVMAEEQRI